MGLVACSQVAQIGELERSLDTWRSLKAAYGEHYRYESNFGSWVGFSSVTTFEVQGEVVVTRSYEATSVDGTVSDSWVERGAEVGRHEVGEPPRTLEQVYGVCRDEVLTKDRVRHTIYLEFQENGVLSLCEYAEKSCVDDCSRGVDVRNLRFLTPPASPDTP